MLEQLTARLKKSESGNSLISVLIAVAILGIIAAASSELMSNLLHTSQHIEIKGDREAVKQVILDQISCTATFAAGANQVCPQAQTRIDLMGKHVDGTSYKIIEKNGTKYGKWTYRAECDSTQSVIVRATMAKDLSAITSNNPNDFREDPLTKKKFTWTDPKSLLFPNDFTLCGSGYSRVKIVTSTYTPQCAYGPFLSWMAVGCPYTMEIPLGGHPKKVEIMIVNDNAMIGALPLTIVKTSSMPGWRTVVFKREEHPPPPLPNVAGFIAGLVSNLMLMNECVSFTDNGFVVRKTANIRIEGLLLGGFLFHTRNHYTAYVEQ